MNSMSIVIILLVNCFVLSSIAKPEGPECNASYCGFNAKCTVFEGKRVCSCLNFYLGDPKVGCNRVECLDDEDCKDDKVCSMSQCMNPCSHLCGGNARCETKNHRVSCTCASGYIGNPLIGCTPNPLRPCEDYFCGSNAECDVDNDGAAFCKCLASYVGNATEGCYRQCETDDNCPGHLYCSGHRCEDPCSRCGIGANCKSSKHIAKCYCPQNHHGNPNLECIKNCNTNRDCPAKRPECIMNQFSRVKGCVNPCEKNCGPHAICQIKENINKITTICTCPKDRTGDPYYYCRPIEDDE